jgi:hypothetical protein
VNCRGHHKKERADIDAEDDQQRAALASLQGLDIDLALAAAIAHAELDRGLGHPF